MGRISCSLLIFICSLPGTGAAAEVDTSDWACEFCPFEDGLDGVSTLSTVAVSDDTAYLGNGTGLDEEGISPNLDSRGSLVRERRSLRWNIEDLGLSSRVVSVDGGEAGRYAVHLDWRELPYRRFITTETVFKPDGGDLVLPPDWVKAPTTDGFSALNSNLAQRSIASDRRNVHLGGRFSLTPELAARMDLTRRDNEGVRIKGGSTFTNASQLPARIDHQTNDLELGLRYGTGQRFVGINWLLSDFDNRFESLNWEQPFSTAPGAESGQLARPPDNQFQQLRISGGYALNEWRTVIGASAAFGTIEQNADFLPYTLNPELDTAPLPRAGLGGSVDTTQIIATINARPAQQLRLRGSYRFDERDNNTPVAAYRRVITDTFTSGETEFNTPFSHRRRRIEGSADWDVLSMVRVSTGFEYSRRTRSLQEVSSQRELLSYGRLRLRPIRSIEVTARHGNSRRDIDAYDETLAIDVGQNPLLRKYNLAYRFREFTDLRASWSPASIPISITLTGLVADDSYTRSQLGMTNGREDRFTADLNWRMSERSTLFLNTGIDAIAANQVGSEAFAAADWRGKTDDRFIHVGGGFHLDRVAGKTDLRVNAMTSRGTSDVTLQAITIGTAPYPRIRTELDRIQIQLRYPYSDTTEITLGATYQRFSTDDWALQSVSPAATPQLFALGAEPLDEQNVIFMLGIRFLGDKP